MLLKDLLKPWNNHIQSKISVRGLSADDRLVKEGYVFFAVKGTREHARQYIDNAIALGAVAIVYDAHYSIDNVSIPCISIPNMESQLGAIASRFYGDPTQHMRVIGVTGTNGKTTVAYLLTQALDILSSAHSFYVGTLGIGELKNLKNTGMTTPGPIELQSYCCDFLKNGAQFLSMEVSSHGLDQHRVSGIPFEQAIFTNLTHDHLDYHGTFEHYASAKAKLFQFTSLKSMIFNADDPWMSKMLTHANPSATVYTYGMHHAADVHLVHKQWTLDGMILDLETPWGAVQLSSLLLGDFNVYNIMAVFTSLMAQGYALDVIISIIPQLKPAPGRMEVVAKHPLVIVDYAHTPDALENALRTLRGFQKETKAGLLWVVFGCGGDRDPLKRPMMGKIASEHADRVIVTSDNPRHENPEQIIEQILSGMTEAVEHISDRKTAIQHCLEKAATNDIILIAGKGHEEYQQIGDIKTYFSDQAVVHEYVMQNH